jgi:hypothetical protein
MSIVVLVALDLECLEEGDPMCVERPRVREDAD